MGSSAKHDHGIAPPYTCGKSPARSAAPPSGAASSKRRSKPAVELMASVEKTSRTRSSFAAKYSAAVLVAASGAIEEGVTRRASGAKGCE